MRCIECEEIELARVRDERPGQTLPVPFAALDGFPAGRSPRDLTRRRLLQWGVAGFASVYAAKELGWDRVWEAVAAAADAPGPRVLVLLYLAGGNDGLNVLLPNGAGDSDALANYNAYVDARTALHRGLGPTVGNAVGSRPLATDSPLAFSNAAVSKNGDGDNAATKLGFAPGGEAYGFDALYDSGALAV